MNQQSEGATAPVLPLHRQYALLGLVSAGLLLASAFYWFGAWLMSPQPIADQPTPPGTFRPTHDQLQALSIQTVGLSSLDRLTTASGTIVADGDLSTPVLMPYSGQVVRVLVDAGAIVGKGQPLLIVRTPDFVDARNTLFSAQAALRNAQSQLANARRAEERQRQIYLTAGGAEKDYLQSQTDLAAATAAERAAEAAVGAARDKLAIMGKSPTEISRLERSRGVDALSEETALLAPIGGLVASRDVSPGQYVSVGAANPLFTITNPSQVWLIAQLPESEAATVHVGDDAEVTTPGLPGRVFHAKIDNVGAALDLATHRLPVRATIANPDGALKPQMFVTFSIHHRSTARAIRVPATAVIHEGDTARVWVLRPDGLLVARTIRLGEEQDGFVEVTQGLRAGERIVTAGALFVNEAGLGE